jgi:hypothetical protein
MNCQPCGVSWVAPIQACPECGSVPPAVLAAKLEVVADFVTEQSAEHAQTCRHAAEAIRAEAARRVLEQSENTDTLARYRDALKTIRDESFSGYAYDVAVAALEDKPRPWEKNAVPLDCPDCGATGSTPLSTCLRCGGTGSLDKSQKLSPCPCCGYRAAIEQVPHDPETPSSGGYYIECKRAGCGITTRLAFACKDDPLPGLIESWNRRAVSSATAQSDKIYTKEDAEALCEIAVAAARTRDGCPCLVIGACSHACSCVHPFMSGGCQRCAKYGSGEQREAAARYIADALAQYVLQNTPK